MSNNKIRFIIIPLGIELENGSHANYLIFDYTVAITYVHIRRNESIFNQNP